MLFLAPEKVKTGAINRAQKAQFSYNAELQEVTASEFKKLCVNAGLSPDEAYREMDNLTMAVLNPAGEFATYARVNAVSKSVGLGKLSYVYRQASTQAGGTVSMSGQEGIITDKVQYKNANTPVPIIDHGTERQWREMLTFGADGFDTTVDDAREAELVILRTANKYLWNGDKTVIGPDDSVWLGLKADPSLVQTTSTVDLSVSTTPSQTIVDTIGEKLDILRITNNCVAPVDLAIARTTMSHWDRTPFSVGDKAYGSLLEYVRGMNGIKSVYEEPQITSGKEFLMANIDLSGLHAVTGQAMSSYMAERPMHQSPFVMVKWMAQGFICKSDYAGHKTALYCTAA